MLRDMRLRDMRLRDIILYGHYWGFMVVRGLAESYWAFFKVCQMYYSGPICQSLVKKPHCLCLIGTVDRLNQRNKDGRLSTNKWSLSMVFTEPVILFAIKLLATCSTLPDPIDSTENPLSSRLSAVLV